MPFNRVIKHFVIQGGGDFERHGATEDWTTRGKHYSQLDSRFSPLITASANLYIFGLVSCSSLVTEF